MFNKSIKIGKKFVGEGQKTFIVAELSGNHNGDYNRAVEIIHAAAEAGADAVKLQTYTADTITIDCDKPWFMTSEGSLWEGRTLHDLYKEAYTPWEWHEGLIEQANKLGLECFSSPFDFTAVDYLENLKVPAYKIASFELNDIPLIEYAASKGKPMIMSCGMATPEDIQDAVDACRRMGNDQIVLLKCCSEYPANWEDMHLGNIPDMRERFHVHVGLSDHSFGSLGAVLAVALGAQVIEKHVKIAGVESPDSKFSMEMPDYAQMIQDANNAKAIAKGPDYSLSPKEQNQTMFRRSLFAVKDIAVGDEITKENVRSIRPSNGIRPKYLKEMLGKKAKSAVPYGHPIMQEFFDSLE